MEIFLLNTSTREIVRAQLLPAIARDMRNITDGWMFNWRRHFGLPGAKAFKVITGNNEIQGLMIFQVVDGEPMMAYLESAPENRGDNKAYDYVAGCLIAYACRLSLIHGKDWHQGFLSFQCMDEEVIRVYHYKYGAVRLDETWMFIEPPQGAILIEKYIERTGETNANDLEVIREREELENDAEDNNDIENNQQAEELGDNHENQEDD
jgi:hypothetical protein